MDKQQIIDYVMRSPANTNPNVLGSIIESLIDENSGYKIETNYLVQTSNVGTTIANLTKIGPLVVCEFIGKPFESNLVFRFPSGFKPDQTNPKARAYNNSKLYIQLGATTVGFTFSQYQGQGEDYYLSIKGDSSSYVGQTMSSVIIYFADTNEPII